MHTNIHRSRKICWQTERWIRVWKDVGRQLHGMVWIAVGLIVAAEGARYSVIAVVVVVVVVAVIAVVIAVVVVGAMVVVVAVVVVLTEIIFTFAAKWIESKRFP